MFYNQIVLFSGKQGSGKSTAQNLLVELWHKISSHHRAKIVNFADPLYEMHDAVRAIADNYGLEKKMPKDGPLLQMLGTDWARKTIADNVWVNALKKKIELISVKDGMFAYDHSLFIVGDCRFRNEFDAFPGALRVRLNCSEPIRKERCSMWRENSQHASEIDLDGYVEENRFDLSFDSAVMSPQEIVEKILTVLASNQWTVARVLAEVGTES